MQRDRAKRFPDLTVEEFEEYREVDRKFDEWQGRFYDAMEKGERDA